MRFRSGAACTALALAILCPPEAVVAAAPSVRSEASNSGTAVAYHRHSEPVTTVASQAGPGIIATGDRAGAVYLWRLTEAATPLDASLRQEGPGIGTAPGSRLSGPVAALAFADARCNGPQNPAETGCGLPVAGAGGAGFSYLRLYDWQRGQVLAAAEVLRGRLTQVAAVPGGAEIAACPASGAIQGFRPDGNRNILIRAGSSVIDGAAAGAADGTGGGCAWIGYDPASRLRVAASGRLVALPAVRAAEGPVTEASPRTMALGGPFAVAPAAAPFAIAVGKPRQIARPDRQLDAPRRLSGPACSGFAWRSACPSPSPAPST